MREQWLDKWLVGERKCVLGLSSTVWVVDERPVHVQLDLVFVAVTRQLFPAAANIIFRRGVRLSVGACARCR